MILGQNDTKPSTENSFGLSPTQYIKLTGQLTALQLASFPYLNNCIIISAKRQDGRFLHFVYTQN